MGGQRHCFAVTCAGCLTNPVYRSPAAPAVGDAVMAVAGIVQSAGVLVGSVLRPIAWYLLGLIAANLIAGNVFLNCPIGPLAIHHKPEKFQLQWSHGVTWWPGYATLWAVKVSCHVPIPG